MKRIVPIFLFFLVSDCFGRCNGRFVNPITDICWSCLFPITVGGLRVSPGGEDTGNPRTFICFCGSPIPRIGIADLFRNLCRQIPNALLTYIKYAAVPVRNFPNSCKKSLVTIFLLICCRVFAGTDYAKEGEEFARKQLEESKSLNLEKTFESIKDLEMRIRSIPIGEGKGCKDCGSEVRNIRPQEADEENGLLVFVSFSMPDASLKQLSDQSEKYGAILIMRGIHEGSFSKMKDKILSVDKGGLKFCIDPALFQKYDIRAAPVFVLVKDGKEINRLSGNVDLEFASSKLEEE